MTPLVQSMSVFTTLALLMVTPPSLTATLAVLPSTVLTSCPSSLTTSAARTLPGITWYLRMAVLLSLVSGLRRLSTVPSGSLAKASSVGARTVNGPWPLSVSTRSAALTAATRVLNEPAPTAVSTMSFFSPTKAGTTRASAATIPRSVRMIELPHVMSCEGSKFVTGNFIYTRNESDRHLPGVSQARAAGCLAYSTINSDLRCGRWAPTYQFRAFPVATWGVEGVAWPAVSWRRVGGRGRRCWWWVLGGGGGGGGGGVRPFLGRLPGNLLGRLLRFGGGLGRGGLRGRLVRLGGLLCFLLAC